MNNVKEFSTTVITDTPITEITTPTTKVKGAVKITDIDIPFFSMMGLVFKIGMASIPVFIVLSFLWYSLNTMLGL